MSNDRLPKKIFNWSLQISNNSRVKNWCKFVSKQYNVLNLYDLNNSEYINAHDVNDILKIVVIERHMATGRVGKAFVHGFGLKTGAIGSTVAHDAHNIVIVGTNDRDMYEVFKRILQQRNTEAALQAVAIMHQSKIIDVTPSIAMAAAKISHEMKLPMADSLILVTAHEQHAILWTQDADFKGIQNVEYVKK